MHSRAPVAAPFGADQTERAAQNGGRDLLNAESHC